MAFSKPSSFTLNPSWPHYGGVLVTILAVLTGLGRYVLIDSLDPSHCGTLMNRGSWLDFSSSKWQPDGCMLHSYSPFEGGVCVGSRRMIFIGDSVTRKLFFQFAHILDSKLPTTLPDSDKHSDHTLHTSRGSQISFIWDPFLNSTNTHDIITPKPDEVTAEGERPALLVLGSGLWYLRYAETSGGLQGWEANVYQILDSLAHSPVKPADEIVLLPVEQIVPSKLSPDRFATMRTSDIEAMNSDLYHRLHPQADGYTSFTRSHPPSPARLPLVFNQMLDPSLTDDGLHFSDSVVRSQANILLNLRCNDVLPKHFPFDKTCCRSYPWPTAIQFIILTLSIFLGPCLHLHSYRQAPSFSFFRPKNEHMPLIIFSLVVTLTYAADRTGLWLKEQKQFDVTTFGFLSVVTLGVGLATVQRADKELGFLNRDQTDEWKGWMQVAILIYHYLNASKVSGIYNPIRVLVASYLFMTGYGHTTFYLRKADYGLLRIAQVMIRLNFLTLLLAYTMNTDYISYYFAPLVSMWFMIIYVTMAVGSQYNEVTIFLLCKVLLSAAVVTWFMSESWLLETAFSFLSQVFGIQWSAREWSFRVNLDLWIVYVGMLAAVAVLKIRDLRLTDHRYWPHVVKAALLISSCTIIWFFGFELNQESKFTYNLWHPYISPLPVLAFVMLRNANVILRSASSRFFMFVGRCSLETFILQYHYWLAGDAKGVLLVIPGTQWRPINLVFTTIMFVFMSDQVAKATGMITDHICGTTRTSLPTHNTSLVRLDTHPQRSANVANTQQLQEIMIPLVSSDLGQLHKDNEGNLLPPEPDTPIRPRRWVDRLSEGHAQPRTTRLRVLCGAADIWQPGLKLKLGIAAGLMWLANVTWTQV